ncbi:MAG: rhodanese-like domain-containing protein [Cyanobacteria bacterium REEB65]|nr:rhodanese-like domain-containing protein [Cyanobacteria bacterium REEB65]
MTLESRIEPLSCRELHGLLEGNAPPTVLDCREPFEWDICHLEGSRLIPMRSLPSSLASLDPAAAIVVLCHHGPRSQRACEYLRNAGFSHVRWLEGGIDAWARSIDPTMARY